MYYKLYNIMNKRFIKVNDGRRHLVYYVYVCSVEVVLPVAIVLPYSICLYLTVVQHTVSSSL